MFFLGFLKDKSAFYFLSGNSGGFFNFSNGKQKKEADDQRLFWNIYSLDPEHKRMIYSNRAELVMLDLETKKETTLLNFAEKLPEGAGQPF